MLDKNSESHVHVEAVEEPLGKSIAFGLERMGLIAVKAPILSCIVLAVLIVAALFGINRIKIDDSLSQLFRSDSKDYKQYEAVTKRFPATEFGFPDSTTHASQALPNSAVFLARPSQRIDSRSLL